MCSAIKYFILQLFVYLGLNFNTTVENLVSLFQLLLSENNIVTGHEISQALNQTQLSTAFNLNTWILPTWPHGWPHVLCNECQRRMCWNSTISKNATQKGNNEQKNNNTQWLCLKTFKIACRKENFFFLNLRHGLAKSLKPQCSLWLGRDTTMLDTIPTLSRLVISPTAKEHSSLQGREHIGQSIWILLWTL